MKLRILTQSLSDHYLKNGQFRTIHLYINSQLIIQVKGQFTQIKTQKFKLMHVVESQIPRINKFKKQSTIHSKITDFKICNYYY